VGAQVAGQIIAFGKDKDRKPIDYGSRVEADMILAQIDDSLYSADAAQSAAQQQQAQAQLASAEANLEQSKAKFRQAERDWQRAQKIGPSDALAQSTFDAYQGAFEAAKADVAVCDAAILQARGAIAQTDAAVQRTKRNLSYCVIKSPVKGVIIDRRVNIGQTVVSSLNAPSLFLIAKDLTRIQVWIAVNEADIGNIKPGQPVTFTVDAYPNRTFKGEVGKVRLNATMTQNVVTYTVEVVAENADSKLLPYLTANAKFLVDKHENVLTVPNAALRWTPLPTQIAPDARDAAAAGGRKGRSGGGAESSGVAVTRGTVWIQEGAYVRPVRVRTGLSDGLMTEIMSSNLTEKVEVVIAAARPAGSSGGGISSGGSGLAAGAGSSGGDTVNPFAPKMPFGGKR
ncbi:MAG: efflux RND transporter periplasmic adaptor subunit, partial [Kiritimatiellaeota bacterium]|nr:efflux RND transporter periplasmic adaptor subunit [Kiritimatiellota bacterium]